MWRIPKEIREEAALICAIGASHDKYICVAEIEAALDYSVRHTDAGSVACDAYHSQTAAQWPMYSPERYAEAEALLRTGWSP